MRCCLPPFVNLIKASIKDSKQHSMSSSTKKRKEQQQLTEKITTEMAFGFKRILNETEQLQKGRHTPSEQAEIIHYAIECLTLNLMFYFSHYREEPKNLFKEILQLYLLAERVGNSKIDLDSSLHRADTPTNIRLVFKRVLLLQLLDPFHLHMGEIWYAYDYLGWWASHARIAKVPEQMDNHSGRFLVDLQGNIKPKAFSPEAIQGSDANFLLLDTIPLTAIANKHLQSLSESLPADIPGYKKNPNVPANTLFRHMLLAWHIQPKRRHDREEKHDWVVAATGINQVCHFLKTQKLTTLHNRPDENTNADHDELEITSVIGGHTQSSYNTFRLRRINSSISGSALVIHPDQENSLQIGQIIIMQSEIQTGTKNKGLSILLKPKAISVVIFSVNCCCSFLFLVLLLMLCCLESLILALIKLTKGGRQHRIKSKRFLIGAGCRLISDRALAKSLAVPSGFATGRSLIPLPSVAYGWTAWPFNIPIAFLTYSINTIRSKASFGGIFINPLTNNVTAFS